MDRNHERAWWGLSAGATLVFGLACAAQFNDPDPLGWIGMYGAAAALSAVGALRPVRLLAGGLLAVCVVWLGVLFWNGLPAEPQPMKYGPQSGWLADEVVREGGGLLLVGAWMAVLSLRGRKPRIESQLRSDV